MCGPNVQMIERSLTQDEIEALVPGSETQVIVSVWKDAIARGVSQGKLTVPPMVVTVPAPRLPEHAITLLFAAVEMATARLEFDPRGAGDWIPWYAKANAFMRAQVSSTRVQLLARAGTTQMQPLDELIRVAKQDRIKLQVLERTY